MSHKQKTEILSVAAGMLKAHGFFLCSVLGHRKHKKEVRKIFKNTSHHLKLLTGISFSLNTQALLHYGSAQSIRDFLQCSQYGCNVGNDPCESL